MHVCSAADGPLSLGKQPDEAGLSVADTECSWQGGRNRDFGAEGGVVRHGSPVACVSVSSMGEDPPTDRRAIHLGR